MSASVVWRRHAQKRKSWEMGLGEGVVRIGNERVKAKDRTVVSRVPVTHEGRQIVYNGKRNEKKK